MDLTVAVATYGAPSWEALATERAIPSAEAEGVEVVYAHRDTLQNARNAALDSVTTEWVVFLDADDELEPGYVAAIEAGSADLRAPAVSYVRPYHPPRRPGMPKVAGHRHACTADCLPQGNWLVIGTAVRAQMVRDVGRWHDWACYEDWDLWLRCWQAGATVEAIPKAVYRAHVRFDSRNRGPSIASKNAVHHAIVAANFPVAA